MKTYYYLRTEVEGNDHPTLTCIVFLSVFVHFRERNVEGERDTETSMIKENQ